MTEKIYNFPVKTFKEENLLEEMLNSGTGTIFILGKKIIPRKEGDDLVELIFAEIKRSISN